MTDLTQKDINLLFPKAPPRAKYKIDLHLRPMGGEARLLTGRIGVSLSSSSTGPEGDVTVLRCCWCKAIVDPDFSSGDNFFCPSCTRTGLTEYASDGAFFRLTPGKLADLILDYWKACGTNADILLRRYKASTFQATQYRKEGDWRMYHKISDRRREQTERVLYPMQNILRDNLAGADVRKRFLALVRA